MKKLIVLSLLFFAGCASYPFEGWTREDTYHQAAVTVIHGVDYFQTLEISDNPDKYEETGILARQIIGKHPSRSSVNEFFASTLVLKTLIPGMFRPSARKYFQGFFIFSQGFYVMHNFSIDLNGD